jgi:hypothetical protein
MLDHQEFDQFVKKYENFSREYNKFVSQFLLKMAYRTVRGTKLLTPVDTGDLRNRWDVGSVKRSGQYLYVEIINSLEYASYVEDGHWQHKRWLPGIFSRNKFKYVRGAKTGIMLREKWIPGRYMARISIAKIQQEIPRRYEMEFNQFIARLGA